MTGVTYLEQIPDHARRLQQSRYVVRWSDMDAFGHVNNARYFTYFEQVRVDWLQTIASSHSLVLATVGCTFKQAISFPASIDVSLYAGVPGRRSVDSYYEIRDADAPDCLYTLGHGTIVWFDHTAGHSMEIPAEIRRFLA